MIIGAGAAVMSDVDSEFCDGIASKRAHVGLGDKLLKSKSAFLVGHPFLRMK